MLEDALILQKDVPGSLRLILPASLLNIRFSSSAASTRRTQRAVSENLRSMRAPSKRVLASSKSSSQRLKMPGKRPKRELTGLGEK